MKRIRLQVQIMPIQGQALGTPAAQTRPDAILKWCEPCTEDLTIQALTDRIVTRWAKKYVGYG